jgi:hypothetical protein
MPYPENMCYVRWEFGWRPTSATSDIEIQDFGLWGVVEHSGGAFPDWQAVVDSLAEQAVGAWADNMTEASFSGSVKARRAVAYHYDQAHNEVLHRGEFSFDPDNTWSGSGDVLPPQLTVVVSTYGFEPGQFATQAARKRGRYYLPTPAAGQVNSSGLLSSGNQSAFLEAAQAFQNDLTGELDIPGEGVAETTRFRPYVSSTVGNFATLISFLRVGQVIDTQRRRRNKLVENYVSGPVNT